MLKAQERGHKLFHYLAEALTYQDGRLYAGAHEVSVQRCRAIISGSGAFAILDLGADVDVVLMRQDPPFDLGYITATHLLERIQDETLVVNDPAAVRNAPEKVWVLDFAQFMPPTMLTRSLGAAREFLRKHGEIVVKPLHGNAGEGVFKIGRDGSEPRAADGAVQRHLPRAARRSRPSFPKSPRATSASCWSTARSPARSTAGRRRANSAPTSPPAARPRQSELTDTEREICAALGPELKRRGLLFVGIDVIGGLADRNQRHLADRHRRHRQVQRQRHAGPDLGRDRSEGRRPMSDWIIRLIEQSGYLGVGFLMFLETVFPPIPSEVIMSVAGRRGRAGQARLLAASSPPAPPAQCSAISSGISPRGRSASSGWSRSSAAGAAGSR